MTAFSADLITELRRLGETIGENTRHKRSWSNPIQTQWNKVALMLDEWNSQELTTGTEHQPWCVLCGQRHSLDTKCDADRMRWLRSLNIW